MRKLILLILLLPVIQLFATGYYVGLTASGSGNGSNWANKDAWSDNWWGSISAGDTIFVDGGVDSVVYTSGKTMGASGSSGAGNITGSIMAGNYICIMPGRYSPSPSGHSGKVIMEPSGAGFENSGGYDYIYIKGFTIRSGSGRGVYMYNNTSHIILDSLTIYEMDDMGTWWESSSYIEIKNCIIKSKLDNASPADDNNYAQYCDHFYIHHNFLHMRNGQYSGGTNHLDNFQMAAYNHAVYFYNNICLTDSAVQGHNIILGTNSQNGTSDKHDTTFVYNNYFYDGGDPGCNTQRSVYFRYPEDQSGHPLVATMVAINNTIVTSNWGAPNLDFEGGPGFASNNIILQTGVNGSAPGSCEGGDFMFNANSESEFETTSEYNTYADSQHTNLLYRFFGGVEFAGVFMGPGGSPEGTPSSWSNWTSSYSGDGVNDNPHLAKNWRIYTGSNNPFELQATSHAIDAGTNMSYWLNRYVNYLPDFSADTDILGNPRDANWDIGVFEYVSGGWTPPDTTAAVTFTSVSNAELGSYHIGTGVLSGADTTFWVLSSPDSFDINYPFIYDVQADSAHSADTVKIPCVASGSYSTTVTKTIKVSGINKTFSVTTKADPAGGEAIIGRFSNGKIMRDSTGRVIKVKK